MAKQQNRTGYTAALIMVMLFAFLGCKEVPPFIDYSKPILLALDTTYTISPLPAAQDKNVLIEDISGVRCVNCPDAATIAHKIVDKYPKGRVVVLTLHSDAFNKNFTRPIKDTFNTFEATEIVDKLIGMPTGLPSGSVDRTIFSGKTNATLAPSSWSSYADQQLTLKSGVNVDLEVIPDASKRTVIANVKTTFLINQTDPMYLSVFITESHIISPQYFPSGEQEDYEHNFILRKGITQYNGLKLADNVEMGRVFEKGFEFTIPEKWNFENCSVVVMVNKVKAENNDVLQSVEKALKK